MLLIFKSNIPKKDALLLSELLKEFHYYTFFRNNPNIWHSHGIALIVRIHTSNLQIFIAMNILTSEK